MLNRFVVMCALAAVGLGIFGDTASACRRRHHDCCCPVVCEPCHPCLCVGKYQDCCTGICYDVLAFCCCPCCCNYPHWACCEVVLILNPFQPVDFCACICVTECFPLDKIPANLRDQLKRAGRQVRAEGAEGSAARIVVHVPDDVSLTVDGEATVSTSSRREFVTPPLSEGVDYQYTFTAKLLRDGKTTAYTRKVVVRAGEESDVTFNFPAQRVAKK